MSIEITGLDEMRERLRLLDQRVRQEFVLKAVKAGANVIASAMQEQAPERVLGPTGDALPIGALRADIAVHERLDKDGFAVARIGPGKDTAYVARWVEYGHRMVAGGQSKLLANSKTRGSGLEIGFVPAHPFLRPAYERSEDAAIDAFKERMRVQLAEAVR